MLSIYVPHRVYILILFPSLLTNPFLSIIRNIRFALIVVPLFSFALNRRFFVYRVKMVLDMSFSSCISINVILQYAHLFYNRSGPC